MKNKILILVIIILIPFTVSSFYKNRETTFSFPELLVPANKYFIKVKKDNQILTIDLDTYLIGVLAGEVPASFEEEALKAQAVASRTFALKKLQTKSVLSSTTSDQVYLSDGEMHNIWKDNYDYYYNRLKNAVLSTTDEVIKYDDELITAYYFSMSNGSTENSMSVFNEYYPYLISVASNWDENNLNYQKETSYSKSDFCLKLDISCKEIKITDLKRNSTGHVASIKINEKSYSGVTLRSLLGLRSTDFEIIEQDENIVIRTKGYGHGVGLSQYGANELAKIGYNYSEILKYYYTNVTIEKI